MLTCLNCLPISLTVLAITSLAAILWSLGCFWQFISSAKMSSQLNIIRTVLGILNPHTYPIFQMFSSPGPPYLFWLLALHMAGQLFAQRRTFTPCLCSIRSRSVQTRQVHGKSAADSLNLFTYESLGI